MEPLNRYAELIRRKWNMGPEIFSAAYCSPTWGTGGPRSWVEEELEKQPNHSLHQMASTVTEEQIAFANGPFRRNSIWRNLRTGRDIMIAIVTAGIIALECERQGLYHPPLTV